MEVNKEIIFNLSNSSFETKSSFGILNFRRIYELYLLFDNHLISSNLEFTNNNFIFLKILNLDMEEYLKNPKYNFDIIQKNIELNELSLDNAQGIDNEFALATYIFSYTNALLEFLATKSENNITKICDCLINITNVVASSKYREENENINPTLKRAFVLEKYSLELNIEKQILEAIISNIKHSSLIELADKSKIK